MKKAKRNFYFKCAGLTLLATCCVEPARAGTPGAYMNSGGFGKAAARITYSNKTNVVTSLVQSGPCAAINPQGGFSCVNVGALPVGTPSTVFCQSRGFPNYVWSIQSSVTGGATADDPELESRITLTPEPCAAYAVDSAGVILDANSAVITVDASATKGAAVWLRALEFLGTGVPPDLTTLEGNSKIKADILLVGPFDLKNADCKAVTIPITTDTGIQNLYFVVNAAANSVPFTITCPDNLVFSCSDSVSYPTVHTSGGCGAVNVTFAPSAASLPLGVTTVTATATDEAGNSAQCTFTATRQRVAGDLNGDCCVDRSDLTILVAKIQARSNDLTYDLNGDGKVDVADARKLVLLFTNPGGASCNEHP